MKRMPGFVGTGLAVRGFGQVAGRENRCRRQQPVMMGKEMKVKGGSQFSGRNIEDMDGNPMPAKPPIGDLEEVTRKNTAKVDKDEVESAEDPFEEAQRKQRTTVLPELSAEEKKDLRVSFDSDPAVLTRKLLACENDEQFLPNFVANRHLMSTAYLYNLTSLILKAESEMDNEGDRLRDLRAMILDGCAVMDRPFFVATARADLAVRDVVAAPDVKGTILKVCGDTTQEANSMWIVLHGAIAAWELQAESGTPSPYQQKVYDQLTGALNAFLNLGKVKKVLGDEFKLLTSVFFAPPEEKKSALDKIDEELVVSLCLLCCQVERLKPGAYRGLTRKLYDVRNYVLTSKYGLAPKLDPARFTPVGLPLSTSFDQFIRQNETAVNASLNQETGGPLSTFGF